MANAPPLWSSKPKVHDRNLLYFSPFYLSANRRYSTSFSSKHPYACCRQRWQHEGGNGSSRAHKSRTWNQYISMLDDSIALAPLFEQRGRISCFQSHCRCGQYLKTTVPTVLFDTSSLPLEKHSLGSNSVNPDHVPYANVGLNEPHVAGTKWSDAILEKKGLGSCHPQTEPTDLEGFLTSRLPSHSNLYRGQLKNGLHYLILPNKIPANGFEAYMEVRVGSIDEEDDEQGIAHMIEHVAFLGSKKRERLLETGAQSNAYTDFHHTVFHIHSPTSTKDSDGDLLPFVLDALNEIAFQPKFLTCRVEKERQAILSELQMMNSIEYRVHCQLLQHLHSENKLSKRFPIGLEQQIKKWNVAEIRRFHERWYFPGNATLYVVGDINNLTKTVYRIETIFSQTFAGVETAPLHTQRPFGAMVGFLVPKLSVELAGKFSNDGPSISKDQSGSVRRLAVRPLVEHQWSLAGTGQNAKPPQIFQHELLQNFSFHVFRKIPVKKVQTYGDLRNVLMERIFLSALHFRINTISKSPKPPFTSIEFDHSDSGREGCTVSTLTVTAEPQNWCNAIKVAVQEVRRLKEFGITKGELARYMDPLLKDGEQSATKIDNVQSVDLDFIMENEALGHTIMDQSQGAQSLVAVAETVTLAEINSTGAEMLEFISDFGKPIAPLPAAIVACAPKKVSVDGMVETEFNIYPHEITEALKAGLEEPIQAEPELEVPKELISSSQLQELRLLCKPSFIPLGQGLNTLKLRDKETGIMQRRLSNGIPVNYKVTKNKTSSGVMRLVVGGGRATESSEAKGAVVVGLRTLREGGWVGKFSREQVELFCVNHLINCSLESTEEFICIEFQFTLGDDGMHAAFQLLHMVLEHSAWLEDAFDKAVQIYLSNYSSIHKRLERLTAHKLMLAMLNGDERFVEPNPKSLKKLTLQSVKEAVMNQFVADNMEVNIVGDFKEDDIESCILDYIGTVKIPRSLRGGLVFNPITFRPSPSELQFQQVYLKDTDDRAHAYIAGPAPSRWGFTVEGQDLFEFINNRSRRDEQSNSEESLVLGRKNVSKIRGHPFFFGITLRLLADIINSRLFATVRDSLGLTYDVSFELSLFDRLNLGWYIISVNSTPGKVCKAVNACKKVLRGLHDNKIAQRELDQSKRALLMRHEAETKSNTYWLRLLTHLQASSVPRKEISGIRGLDLLYEAATIEDIYLAYENLKVDEGSLFSCIGIAGAHAGEDFPGLCDLINSLDGK